jgi:hypothetical protein
VLLCESAIIVLKTPQASSASRLQDEPLWLYCELPKLSAFHFDADPNPAFDFDADSEPAVQFNVDPDPLTKMMGIHVDPDPQYC